MLPFNLDSEFKDPLSIAYTISAEFWVGIILFPIIYFFKDSIKLVTLGSLFIYSYVNILLYSPNFLDIHYHFFNDYLYFGILRCLMNYSLGILAFITYKNIIKYNIKKQPFQLYRYY